MAFALQLHDSLRRRESRIAGEFAAGDSLETVLSRHLLAVEAAAETELTTSILLLDEAGKRLSHGAAPNLPKSYREAIDGIEIGPNVGSCGTAAYTGHAIYVTDVGTDPLWKDFRHLALPHGLRACWSTPIHGPEGEVIGTFAIYHPTPRSPTPEEVESIRLITDHVAQAILWKRARQDDPETTDVDDRAASGSKLRLASNEGRSVLSDEDAPQEGLGVAARLQSYALRLDRYAGMVASQRVAEALKAVAAECRKLGESAGHREEPPTEDQKS